MRLLGIMHALTIAACHGPAAPEPVVVAPASTPPATTISCTRAPRAWLVLLDASKRSRLPEARLVTKTLIARLTPAEKVQVRAFDDRGVFATSPWLDGSPALAFVDTVAVGSSQQRNRDLATIVESAAHLDPAEVADRPKELEIVLITVGNGALGTESAAERVGAALSTRAAMTVVWLPIPMPEEHFHHARAFARLLAGPQGLFLAVETEAVPAHDLVRRMEARATAEDCP